MKAHALAKLSEAMKLLTTMRATGAAADNQRRAGNVRRGDRWLVAWRGP